MNRKQYVLEAIGQEDKIYDYRGGKLDKTKPIPRQQDAEGNFIDDYLQPVMSVAGLFPIVGNFFDLANAGIDVAQGQLGDAGLNALAAVPGFGQFVTGTKLGAKVVGKLGKAEKPVTALARASKSKPAVAASVVGPFAIPYAYDAMTSTPQGTDGSGEGGMSPEQYQKIGNYALSGNRSRGSTVTPGTLQTFRRFNRESLEQTSTDITRCIMENARTKLVDLGLGTGKMTPVKYRLKDTDAGSVSAKLADELKDKGSKFLKTKTGKAAAAGGGLVAAFTIPQLIANMLGQPDQSNPQGSGSAADKESKSGGLGGGGGGASIIDRLSMMYGSIPNWNPAGIAINALGNRIGRMS
jgi:hypothetical protein